jgi:PadR family transcriptional regulator, regulatory protein PadR
VAERIRITEATLDVLAVLVGDEPELYGLRIARATGRPTGSVFPILARLERAGWVVSEWESTDPAVRGPRRRFYRLTADGAVAARAVLGQRRGARRRRAPRLAAGTEGA